MTTFQSGPHGLDVADTFKRVINPAVSQINDDFLNRPSLISRVDEIGCAELLDHNEFRRINVNGNDPRRFSHDETLNHAQTNAAQPENRCRRARSDFGGIQYGADARGDTAAEQANFVQRSRGIDLRQGDFRQDRIFGKC